MVTRKRQSHIFPCKKVLPLLSVYGDHTYSLREKYLNTTKRKYLGVILIRGQYYLCQTIKREKEGINPP